MSGTEKILHPFATEMRHLTSALNVIASDMIRDRTLAKKLDDDPDYFRNNYTVTEDELTAMRERNMIRLYELGLHPFLLVRFAGMMGILEYWQALGAPGRGGGWPRNVLSTALPMTTWTIGSATVTRVEEQLGITNQPCEKYFRNFERDVLERHLDWLAPDHYSPQHDRFVTSVHSWLIRLGDLTILLDTCGGNHKDRPWTHRFHQLDTPYLQRLRAAGAAPEDVDLVLCTHLHADHVGWNTMLRDGRWVPTFPNAKYLFSRVDDAYWDMRKNPAMAARSASHGL